jgi:hypothetical protein
MHPLQLKTPLGFIHKLQPLWIYPQTSPGSYPRLPGDFLCARRIIAGWGNRPR